MPPLPHFFGANLRPVFFGVLAVLLFAGVHDALWRCYAIDCPRTLFLEGYDRYEHLLARAMALKGEGRSALAEEAYLVAIDSEARNEGALIGLADLLRHQGSYAKAELLFLEAIRKKPADDWAYLDLGKLYRNMKRYEDALDMFRKAEKLNPRRAALWSYGYAELYKEIGRFKEAIATAKTAIALEPDGSFNHMALGDAYREARMFVEAEQSYRRAIEIDSHSEAYMGLGWLYLTMERLDDAQGAFEEYRRLIAWERGEVYMALGIIAKRRGDLLEAKRHLAYAHKLNPTIGAQKVLINIKERR